jgi:hypothetical protein
MPAIAGTPSRFFASSRMLASHSFYFILFTVASSALTIPAEQFKFDWRVSPVATQNEPAGALHTNR